MSFDMTNVVKFPSIKEKKYWEQEFLHAFDELDITPTFQYALYTASELLEHSEFIKITSMQNGLIIDITIRSDDDH